METNNTKTFPATFDTTQEMLAFAYLADITSGVIYQLGSHQSLNQLQSAEEATLQAEMQKVITNDTLAKSYYLGKGWECHKNPWIDIQKSPDGDYFARNTTAIFKNGSKVVVAVAGTNFVDNFDWFIEDLEVSTQVDWTTVINGLTNGNTPIDKNKGVIATGTYTALKHTWFQSDDPTSGGTPYLLHALKEVVTGMASVELYVTGHSLGGAITPVLAQALLECKADWAGTTPVNVHAYPFAGPTVGDQTFVNYVETTSNPKIDLNSLYNNLDVVPHGWELSMIDKMHDLFVGYLNSQNDSVIPDADTTKYGALIKWTIDWIKSKATQDTASKDYKRWTSETIVNGDFPIGTESFSKGVSAAVSGINAKIFVGHTDMKDAMKEIIGHDVIFTTDSFYTNCMGYFCKYLLMLKRQHIDQYSEILWNGQFQNAFHEALTQVKGKGNLLKDLSGGIAVLTQLFEEVAAYKKSRKPSMEPA